MRCPTKTRTKTRESRGSTTLVYLKLMLIDTEDGDVVKYNEELASTYVFLVLAAPGE